MMRPKSDEMCIRDRYSLIISMYASVGLVTINEVPITTSQAMFAMQLDVYKRQRNMLQKLVCVPVPTWQRRKALTKRLLSSMYRSTTCLLYTSCTQQYVSKVLKGQKNMSLETLCKIESTLGIEIFKRLDDIE